MSHSEEPASEVKINLDAIPEHTADYLSDIVLKGVREFLKRPNGKEILEARAAKWRAERSASERG